MTDIHKTEAIVVSFLLIVWPCLIPVGAAFYMFYICWTRGGDPEEDSSTVQYNPPENLTPAECGALLANAVLPRHISATIVDLSVKGFLSIESGGGRGAGPDDQQEYVFHLVKQPEEWNSLKLHEHAVLGALFVPTNPFRMLAEVMSRAQNVPGYSSRGATFLGKQVISMGQVQQIMNDPRLRALAEVKEEPRSVVSLSESQNFFYMHKAVLRKYIFVALIKGGYYSQRPASVRQKYVTLGIFMGVLVAFMGRFLATPAAPWSTWLLSSVLTAGIVVGFSSFMPAKTVAGARALGKVRGFADFLGRVEKDRIERLENMPELFEKYLPYAMALSVESMWAQLFGRVTLQPNWHAGQGGAFMSPTELVEGLSAMSKQTGGSAGAHDRGCSLEVSAATWECSRRIEHLKTTCRVLEMLLIRQPPNSFPRPMRKA